MAQEITLMQKKGRDLTFISRILRDGSGTKDITNKDMSIYDDELFAIYKMSITYNTYIAMAFNSFVVKLK